jgi:hypothetical protein
VSYGERSSGKTATMFGFDNQEKAKEYSGMGYSSASRGISAQGGVACGIIKQLYNASNNDTSSENNMLEGKECGRITIALSAWILRGQLIVE